MALKVLPEAFTSDPDRLARFEREAKVLASLNHPNIGSIYGLEEADGVKALVLELIEGPTLADRIAQGPIPLDEALPIAKQIAEALEAAHERGVIHRDLKPANIKVREDGTVKVLDFGLAKALDPTPTGDPSQSPTLTAAATQMGVIMGTAAYMSPEQARGKPVDKRTDVWAFGAVLFEMLTGHTAFSGGDVSETRAAVIKSEPAWDQLAGATHLGITRVLRRCLSKDPGRRARDLGDVWLDLEDATADQGQPTQAAWPRTRLSAAAAGVAVTGLVAWVLWVQMAPAGTPAWPVTRLAVDLPEGLTLDVFKLKPLALSPNGRLLAVAGTRGGNSLLYLRDLNSFEWESIQGTEGADGPFFSPDGEWLGFFANGELRKVLVSGGPVLTICLTPAVLPGATWGPDQTIVFTPSRGGGLYRVSADGGEPQVLTEPAEDGSRGSHVWPQFLPDGESVLFTVMGTGLAVVSVDTADWQMIEGGAASLFADGRATGWYSPTGHVILAASDVLYAAPFSAHSFRILGPPRQVMAVRADTAIARFLAISPAGHAAYLSESRNADHLVLVEQGGTSERLTGESGRYARPQFSPDGTKVVFDDRSRSSDVMVLELRGRRTTRITSYEGPDVAPVWLPDGEHVVFSSVRGGGEMDLYSKRADGTGPAVPLLQRPREQFARSVSSDGELLALVDVGTETREDVWILDRQGELLPVATTAFSETDPQISPDATMIAYRSNESGRAEVYVQSLSSVGERSPVSTTGAEDLRWSRDSRRLYYVSQNTVMVVDIQGGGRPVVGATRTAFDPTGDPLFDDGRILQFDVAPDEGRFVMSVAAQSVAREPVKIILNWARELKERVPIP